MSIKLVLLKSGEDLISEVTEMAAGDEEDRRVVGYFLNKPCNVKIRDSQVLSEQTETEGTNAFKVSLFPWMPLTSDKTIPVPADWVVTITEPKQKLKDMYIEDVVDYGEQND